MQLTQAPAPGAHALIRDEEWIIQNADQCTLGDWQLSCILDGTRIKRPIIDDTLLGGPVERIIEYVAPFGLADREADYRVAWAHFEQRQASAQ